MNRSVLVLSLFLLGTALGTAAAGSPNETEKFLGAEADWKDARLELRSLDEKKTGYSIAVCATGLASIRLVSEGSERRFSIPLEKKDALALLKLAAQDDVLSQKPDEKKPELTLENALGLVRRAPAPERVVTALRALEKKVEGKEPVFQGTWEPMFRPFEGVQVTISMFSGRPDPSFELVRAEDWEKLRGLLSDLEGAERQDSKEPPGLGYRGCFLSPRGVSALPNFVSVYKGIVEAGDSPRARSYKKDQKGLEAWLLEEAKKRAIEVPKK
jgi:hypothetical protein